MPKIIFSVVSIVAQINQKPSLSQVLRSPMWIFMLRLVVLGATIWYIYATLSKMALRDTQWLVFVKQHIRQHAGLIGILLLLSLLNWTLETLKWQLLRHTLLITTFKEALRGVLVGTTLAYLTPAGVGDYAGKLWNAPKDLRISGLGLAVAGNGIQFWVALVAGTIAFSGFHVRFPDQSWPSYILLILLWSAIVACHGLIWHWAKLKTFFQTIPWLGNYTAFFDSFTPQNIPILRKTVLLSAVRYAVFSIQFLLVLCIFEVNLPIADMVMVSALVFLAKTVIPSFSFLSDLGIREFSALYFFEPYGVAPLAVIAATLLLWFTNVCLPMLLGTYHLFRLKFKAV